MQRVDLHLVSWNRPKMTELVIKTIIRNTDPENYRLVVLDNGSDGDTPDMLQQMHDAGLIDELILLKTNIGLEAARNFMLKHSTLSDYFICVDNDCLPPPAEDGQDWVQRLAALMEYYRDFAAIAARTSPMVGTGNIFEEADEHDEDIVEFPHPGGSLRIMRTQAVYDVGGWKREQLGRGSEETYISGKLHEAGLKTAFAAKIKCLHLFGLQHSTDSWGYPKEFIPEDTGHSSGVWHPKFAEGDVWEEVVEYCGENLAKEYFNEEN